MAIINLSDLKREKKRLFCIGVRAQHLLTQVLWPKTIELLRLQWRVWKTLWSATARDLLLVSRCDNRATAVVRKYRMCKIEKTAPPPFTGRPRVLFAASVLSFHAT